MDLQHIRHLPNNRITDDIILTYIYKIFKKINYRDKLDGIAGLIFGFVAGDVHQDHKNTHIFFEIIKVITDDGWHIDKEKIIKTDDPMTRIILCGITGSKCIDTTIDLSSGSKDMVECLITTLIIYHIHKDITYIEWNNILRNIFTICPPDWKTCSSIALGFDPENKLSEDNLVFINVKKCAKAGIINSMMVDIIYIVWVLKRTMFFMNRLKIFEKNKNVIRILKIKFFNLITQRLLSMKIICNTDSMHIILAIAGYILGYSSISKDQINNVKDIDLFKNIFINFIT